LPTLLQALILLTSSKKASVTLVFFFADVCTAEEGGQRLTRRWPIGPAVGQ
jgi:hypothetical protein